MGIHWQDYATNDDVLERARLPNIEAMLLHHAGPAMSRAWTTPGCPKLSSLANSAKACVTEVLHAGATRTSWSDSWYRLVLTTKTGRRSHQTGSNGGQPPSAQLRGSRTPEWTLLRRNASVERSQLIKQRPAAIKSEPHLLKNRISHQRACRPQLELSSHWSLDYEESAIIITRINAVSCCVY